ncbi:MAG: thiamine-phosphate kinase [Candidatus Margulisiibacteriota bacterium]|nr:MAG: thiamine-phosphate kinase [Candidatus Margulisbacteria bacterium GWD2_39_127]OGI04601.1 MAG: thiamine-phosphate kinase [Candidatus Margulisbacteria bacterium GWF2_38_17]OGI11867.1 MAG: thiamine-phosphate kinase [Candidatus Margulisbacteria bacterium GWE2_39_32]PZM83122.1 MAG: thiamine-phosphate kinase [Candidatus Margulisiibacteriota bacterium]HAR62210.1 thiamine-phosphate kinase [Candidatus Margulisiibacteriota bacterium]
MTKLLKELKFLSALDKYPSIEGIGDDCFVSPFDEQHYQLISTDMLVEGNHFPFQEKQLDRVGLKAVTVNVSDILAKGGKPESIFVSLALPEGFTEESFDNLYLGLNEACIYFNVKIRGGDITSTKGPLVINITIVGKVNKNNLAKRSGAKVGDNVYVTGKLGGASAHQYEIGPDYHTMLPVEKIDYIVNHIRVTSMTDISDGLARSLFDITKSSNVGVVIDEAEIPLAEDAILENALNGGEDYQILFTAPTEYAGNLQKDFYYIGKITKEKATIVIKGPDKTERLLETFGYDHFNRIIKEKK